MTVFQDYLKPNTLGEALSILGEGRNTHILAGGTDILLKLEQDKYQRCSLVDITGIDSLSGISASETGLWIGAATKLSDIAKSGQLTGAYQVLASAASLIGSPQIRNMATIGGNLCNASPSADMSAPLLVLEAQLEISSAAQKRLVPLADFFSGPSKTVLEPGEMLTALHIPAPEHGSAATYCKHSTRGAMDLAVAGVSVLLWRLEGQYHARIGLAAVSPTPIRVYQAEQLISGAKSLDDELISSAANSAAETCRPISDIRASAEYRKALVGELTVRALSEVRRQVESWIE